MRIAAIFEKLKGGVNLAPAGDCQRKAIQVSGTSWISSSSTKRLVKFITVSGGFQNSGSWTVNADVDEDVTCKVHFVGYGTIDKSLNTRYYGCAPSTGTATLPFTFDITGVQDSYINEPAAALAIEFAYGDTWGDTDILPEAVQNVTLCGGTEPYSDAENVETAFLRPEEMTDDATIAQAINSKSAVTLKILPGFETWGFCEQTVTYVTIFDFYAESDRTIFRGRVSGIRNAMDSSGNMVQEITCASTLDFLDDTYSQIFNLYETSVDTWVTRFITSFNRDLCDGYDKRWRGWKKGTVFSGSATPTNSMSRDEDKAFKTLKYWVEKAYFKQSGKKIDNNKIEFRERWVNGENYLDVLLKAGTHHQTALLLGDNLKEIAVEQGIETGYYTTVMARSGVCSDGTRITVTVNNSEMLTRYPVSVVVLTNDDIKCTEPMYYVSYSGGARSMTPSDEQREAANALLTWAATQAAKLSTPYVRITLTALDLARIGMADYEGFELGDYYPCVCPPLGLTGQEVRITGIRRKLADGKVAELTVETGERLGDVQSSSGLSGMMAQTASIGDRIGESAAAQADIAQTKAEEQTGGIKIVGLTKSDYDDIPNKDSNTIYKVDNSGTNELYIGEDHIDSGGGGGNSYTIENAVVNTSADWTLEREPLPAYFAGGNGVYYSGPPGKCVIQGQRALFNVPYSSLTSADVMAEVTIDTGSVRQKAKIFIDRLGVTSTTISITPGVSIVSVDSGGTETPVGSGVASSGWSNIPKNSQIQIGIILKISYLGQSGGQLRPYISWSCAIIVDGAPFGSERGVNITGNQIKGYVPWSTAEEHFGTTLLMRTEPSGGGS